MRKIKFRGQSRYTTHEWLYGSLLEICGRYFIKPNTNKQPQTIECEVIPETVCQFTGFLDCNDVEIYEKDVVSCWHGAIIIEFETFDTEQGYILPLDDTDLKVIGNIIESPEMDNQVVKKS